MDFGKQAKTECSTLEIKNKNIIFDDLVENYKRSIIEDYFEIYGNINDMAEALGLSQTTAYRLVNKYVKK